MPSDAPPMRIIGLAGWSGAGKTTLIGKVLPRLVARGLRVSTLKHAHHNFNVDTPGKDSHAHRMAGACEVLVASNVRWALMHELRGLPEPSLAAHLRRLSPVDLVIVEGFKQARHVKLEVHRLANAKPFLFPADRDIAGLVSDAADPGPLLGGALPHVHIDDTDAVLDLMLQKALPLEATSARLGEP